MTFENLMKEIGVLIRETRLSSGLHLDDLGFKSGVVYDNIQKIETSHHGGILVLTYADLLAGLNVGLLFEPMDRAEKKLFYLQKLNSY